jgi:glutamate-1-semialdehyde 2,1-aminomutase
MSAATLRVLRTRRDIACVLVNPVQGLHPNMAPPADASLVDSGRRAGFDKTAYGELCEKIVTCSLRFPP